MAAANASVWIPQQNLLASLARTLISPWKTVGDVTLVAGADISFSQASPEYGALCIACLHAHTLQPLYALTAMVRVAIPYLPGFLAFREAPPTLGLLQALLASEHALPLPQLLLLDSNGVLHERRAGCAVVTAALSGIPCVGVSKTLYAVPGVSSSAVKSLAQEHLHRRGSYYDIVQREEAASAAKEEKGEQAEETLAAVLRLTEEEGLESKGKHGYPAAVTSLQKQGDLLICKSSEAAARFRSSAVASKSADRSLGSGGEAASAAGEIAEEEGATAASAGQTVASACKPVFVSVGGGLCHEDALQLVLQSSHYRVCEPIRLADKLSRLIIARWEAEKLPLLQRADKGEVKAGTEDGEEASTAPVSAGVAGKLACTHPLSLAPASSSAAAASSPLHGLLHDFTVLAAAASAKKGGQGKKERVGVQLQVAAAAAGEAAAAAGAASGTGSLCPPFKSLCPPLPDSLLQAAAKQASLECWACYSAETDILSSALPGSPAALHKRLHAAALEGCPAEAVAAAAAGPGTGSA